MLSLAGAGETDDVDIEEGSGLESGTSSSRTGTATRSALLGSETIPSVLDVGLCYCEGCKVSERVIHG